MVYCALTINLVGRRHTSSLIADSKRFDTANLVLEDTVERIYHGNAFAEHWHGLFLIRGENVVLLGEIVRLPVRMFSHGFTDYLVHLGP